LQKNKNVQCDDHDTISIYEFWLIIRQRRWLIFIITLIFFGFSLLYAFLQPRVYKVSNVVQAPYKIKINMVDIEANALLLKNLPGKQLAKTLNFEGSVIEDIRDIQISKVLGDTESLKIQVDTTDPDSGVKMINALVTYLDELPFVQKQVERQKKLLKSNRDDLEKIISDPLSILDLPDKTIISELLPSLYDLKVRYNQMTRDIRELEEGGFMTLAGKTFVPDAPYKPRRRLLAELGLFAGILIGIFFAVFMEWMVNSRREYETR